MLDTGGGFRRPPRIQNRHKDEGKYKYYNDDDDDDDDDDHDDSLSHDSNKSQTSSIFSSLAYPWMFRNLSSNILPSRTEIVKRETDDDDDDDDIENENDKQDNGNEYEFKYYNETDKANFDTKNNHNNNNSNDKPPLSSSYHKSTKRTNYSTIQPPSSISSSSSSSCSPPPPHFTSNPSSSSHRHNKHNRRSVIVTRTLRRRIFLLLTEPETSIISAIFFMTLIITIALSNLLMMMQTMDAFQYTPEDCLECGGRNSFYTDENRRRLLMTTTKVILPCQCQPSPTPAIVALQDGMIIFFTVEWSLRVICYEPSITERLQGWRFFVHQWLSYLMAPTTLLDALAIFPYYLERYDEVNGFLAFRLLRLFRVFQLVRLGQYNMTFISLTNVLTQSVLSLNILMIVLLFGAAFFGSIIYFLEKGEWKYTTYTDPPTYMYMRMSADGVTEEPTPFTSIPAAFWWFIVTATTVGYGDVTPTSLGGKLVGMAAMLTGVLVIAFPVSVFSDLWSKELKKSGALVHLESDSLVDDEWEDDDNNNNGVYDYDLLSKNKNNRRRRRRRRRTPNRRNADNDVVVTTLGFPNPIKKLKREKGSKDQQQRLNKSLVNDHTKGSAAPLLLQGSRNKSKHPTDIGTLVINADDIRALRYHMSKIEACRSQIQESHLEIQRIFRASGIHTSHYINMDAE